jgi:hypothetical protein
MVRRWAKVVKLAAARRRVHVWHWLLVFAQHRQDRTYDHLVALEGRLT